VELVGALVVFEVLIEIASFQPENPFIAQPENLFIAHPEHPFIVRCVGGGGEPVGVLVVLEILT